MKKYKVYDNQGGSFMEWTHDEPQTLQQIHGYLYSMANDGKDYKDDMWTWNNFRHNFKNGELLYEWGISLEEVE